ncbi:MAG: glycosyltransferase [Planctomycetes bacterium]|nr:glycosyltransferase [Planctomycetota bacterium]
MLSAHTLQLDRRITAEAAALAAAGYEVTILSLPVEYRGCDLHPSVKLVMPRSYLRRAPAGTGRLKGAVASALPWPLYSVLRRAYRALVKGDPLHLAFFVQNTPDGPWHCIHCHDLDTLPAALEIRQRFAPEAQVIYDSHELFPYQFPSGNHQRRWRSLEARYISRADAVITVNPSSASHIAHSYGVTPPTVIYNSYRGSSDASVTEEEFLTLFEAPRDGFRVLFQGAFTPQRNLENLVRAFSLVEPSLRLFLLGAGKLEARLRAIVKRQRLRNVHFGGWVPQNRLLAFTAHAHLGVIPYDGSRLINNRYCTPNKLFEFIEALVPVCSARLPEVTRIIESNGIGASYPLANPREIADAVKNCRSRCIGGDFPSSNRRNARRLYSWGNQAGTLLDLYKSIGG